MKRIFVFLAALVAIPALIFQVTAAISSRDYKLTNEDMANATVQVYVPGLGGGSGVIIESHEFKSLVLTNNHVCNVIRHGGIIQTNDDAKHLIVSFKSSKLHDLCLIEVSADLQTNTKVADHAPAVYSPLAVSGHPALYSTIITRGHFSQKTTISIMTGIRDCTGEDARGPYAIYCAFFGKLPIFKVYESQLISATIMPGSSGSAVYNELGELAGLVFAGAGDLSYGFIIPQEYVSKFLKEEVIGLNAEFPDNTLLTP